MKIMNRRRDWLIVLSLLAAIAFLSACTNLSAVREWSATSVEATQYNEIVATYADTPERLNRYDPSANWEQQIVIRQNQAEALKKILSVVSDYMRALSILASDNIIDYDEDVDSLTSGIAQLDAGISEETLGAVGKIVKALLGAATGLYQKRQVAQIVGLANAPLQTILSQELRDIVDQDFRRDLRIEKAQMRRYYNSKIQTGNPSDAAQVAIMEWKEWRQDQIDRRIMAVDAYLVVLDTIADGHQQLYDNRNRLGAKDLIKKLYAHANELRKQIKILSQS